MSSKLRAIHTLIADTLRNINTELQALEVSPQLGSFSRANEDSNGVLDTNLFPPTC